MMVPNLPSSSSSQMLDPADKPSPTNLLMAAAEMHKQGRFDQPIRSPRPRKAK
jgi:hypothetical protein